MERVGGSYPEYADWRRRGTCELQWIACTLARVSPCEEVEKLIRTYGGEPIVILRCAEVGLESNGPALEFAERLLKGDFDLGGVMTRRLECGRCSGHCPTRFDREEYWQHCAR